MTRSRRGPTTCSPIRYSRARISARPPSNTSGPPMPIRSTGSQPRRATPRSSAYEREAKVLEGARRGRMEPAAAREPAALRDDLSRASGERDAPHAHRARVLRSQGPAAAPSKSRVSCSRGSRRSIAAMQRTAWTVTGNAQFDTGGYADAEGAYLQVQSLLPPQDPEAPAITERLAASIYKQGEMKQAVGNAAGRRRRLPARRQARAGRGNPRDRGVRRRRVARVAQGLAARDRRPRVLSQRATRRAHARPT